MKITTIGGGNGQSNLLDALAMYGRKNLEVSSIVSMSDDGRTTGELMRAFDRELGIHLPPTGDLRRCMFSSSESKFRRYFQFVFESKFQTKDEIGSFSVLDLFHQMHKEQLLLGVGEEFHEDFQEFTESTKGKLYKYVQDKFGDKLDWKLPLSTSLGGHKFGNILMGLLYYNMDRDYDAMLQFMHKFLKVGGEVIPVTTKKAFIRAVLGNGEVIETQDSISNVVDYNSGIADLELMDSSLDATHHNKACDAILDSDYIIVGPGDLFTSIISNFIIGGISECLKRSKAKIIFIGNSTNKGGETMGLTQLDFVNKVERFIGRRIDIFIVNSKKPELSEADKKSFQNDVSVKGGDYIFVSPGEKLELERRKIKLVEADLLGESSFYKHSKKKIVNVLNSIIFN